MTDKYEEFKEWFLNQDRYLFRNLESGDYANMIVFKKFEEEQAEKDKKEKFGGIMCHWLDKSMGNHRRFNLDELFDELKEKDLIK